MRWTSCSRRRRPHWASRSQRRARPLSTPASRLSVTPAVLASVVELVPEEWLETTPWLPDATAVRSAYLEMLLARLANPDGWLPAVAA